MGSGDRMTKSKEKLFEAKRSCYEVLAKLRQKKADIETQKEIFLAFVAAGKWVHDPDNTIDCVCTNDDFVGNCTCGHGDIFLLSEKICDVEKQMDVYRSKLRDIDRELDWIIWNSATTLEPE